MNEWEIREFYGEEAVEYEKLTATAFHYSYEGLLQEEEFKKHMVQSDVQHREDVTDLYQNTFTRYGAFRDGRLVSAFKCYALVVHFDGQRCELGGIGGVASDPELRRTGGASRLMKHALSEMKKNKQILSHLSPFKTSFYQKYGYEHTATAIRWTIPITFFPQGPYENLVRYKNTEAQIQDVKRLYREQIKKYNLSVDRSDARWESLLKRFRAYAGKTFCYFHYTNGVADGFMAYDVREYEKEPMDVNVSKLWFTDVCALRAFLSYLGSMSSYAKKATLMLPPDVNLSPMLSEMQSAYGKEIVTREILNCGATRVVDVEAVLRLAAYRGTGEARIRVSDPTCPWNDHTFHVRFEDGHAIGVEECEECDVEMSIGAFSVMILGGAEMDQAPYFEGITVYGNMENLRKIFYKKNLWIEDSF